MLLQTTTTSASILLGGALDLRHRHPRLWARVQAAEVDDWQARKVARLAAELSWEQTRLIDEATTDLIGDLPWGRALTAVEAAVQKADPEMHELRRLAAERRRYVERRYRGTNAFGMRTMVAQGPVGDVARVDALLDFLARLLDAHGDPDPLQVRRSKAFGLLAHPALVCGLLAAARDAADSQEPSHETSQKTSQEPVRRTAPAGRRGRSRALAPALALALAPTPPPPGSGGHLGAVRGGAGGGVRTGVGGLPRRGGVAPVRSFRSPWSSISRTRPWRAPQRARSAAPSATTQASSGSRTRTVPWDPHQPRSAA